MAETLMLFIQASRKSDETFRPDVGSAGIEIIISEIIKKKKGGKEVYWTKLKFMSRIQGEIYQSSDDMAVFLSPAGFVRFLGNLVSGFGPCTYSNILVTFARVHLHPHRACIQYSFLFPPLCWNISYEYLR